eukprot:jgi/Picsp_1/6703/NSC_04045-R1_125 kda kinesin-related
MASKQRNGRAQANDPTGGGDSETNVQVIVRCRPKSEDEVTQRTPQVIQCEEAHREVIMTQQVGGKQFNRTYHFDKVFSPDTTQERLYEAAISPIVDEVLQGFNCTIFAYGQTGTGKTHTMTGEISTSGMLTEQSGVIPRAIQHIFKYLDGLAGCNEYTVKCCFLELYNEEITDLLAMGSDPPRVRIMEDRSGVVLQGLEEPHVKVADEIFSLLETGNARRRTAETLLNKQSSRSHSVFIVTVSVREVLAEGEEVIRVGKLYLVDLAGSENITRSGAVDQRAKEAGNINKSLLTLGRVITALVEGQVHVPYRDSKLTRLLRDSLGGKTKTCIIATIAPTVQCQEETMSTLDYAHRAKNIKNKPEVNQKISKTTHLKELAVEIARLKSELVATREKNGVYIPTAQYEEDCAKMKEQAERLEFLEAEADAVNQRHEEEKSALIHQWKEKVSEIEQKAEKVQAELNITRLELEAAKEDIAERDYIIDQQRRCENALADHSCSLVHDLTTAVHDIGSLFHRVDVKNDLEDGNRSLLMKMCDSTMQNVSTLEKAVRLAAASQLDLLANTQDEMSNLSALQHDLMSCSHEHIAGAKMKLQEMLSGIKHESQTATLDNSIQEFVQDIKKHLDSAVNEVASMKSHLEEAMTSQSEMAKAMSSGFSNHLQKEETQLLSDIGKLISNFVNQAKDTVNVSVHQLQQRLEEDQQTIVTQMANVGSAVEVATSNVDTHDDTIKKICRETYSENQKLQNSLNSCFNDTIASAENIFNVSSEQATRAASVQTKHSKSVASNSKKTVKALATAAAQHQIACVNAVQAVEQVTTDIEDAIQSRITRQGEVAQTMQACAHEAHKEMTAFATSQEKDLAMLSTTVSNAVNKKYQIDAGRDEVPKNRDRVAPLLDAVNSLRAPSIDALTRTFRSGQANDDQILIQQQDPINQNTDNAPEQQQQQEEEGGDVEQQGMDSENVMPNARTADENTDTDSKTQEPNKASSPVARKRTRSPSTQKDMEREESPSKLRAAYKQSERRRRGRRAAAT